MTSWGDTLRPPLEIAPAARERSGARPTEVPVDRTNGTSGRRLLPRIDRRASPAGLFLGAQERVCRKRATEAGYEVAPSHVYSIVLSGARRDRPDYQRMLADAAAGDFKALFVWKFDRLGRDAEELLRARRMLEAAGVRLVSVTEGEPQAILRYGFEAIIAQDAREKIGERTRLGLREVARSGRLPGGQPPLGYRSEGVKQNRRLVIEPGEAELVRRIVALYLGGTGLNSIARKLNEEGHRTRTGGRFYARTILDHDWSTRAIFQLSPGFPGVTQVCGEPT
jgi:site-specific DNA recombinase